jgi:DNA-binding NarL/FixJ family response regulator
MFRAGVKALLESYADVEIAGEASDGTEAIQQVKELQPDVVVMDIAMPRMDGLTATRLLLEVNPKLKLLFLTQYENKEYIVPALKLGAAGYILKRAAADELVEAIRKVHQGHKYLDSAVTGLVLKDMYLRTEDSKDKYEDLTEREREVLINLVNGKTPKKISEILHVSIKTVEYHKTNMMHKLELTNMVELTKYAMRKGLIE